ncbi:MAG: purine-binding chemotaxis protein CheW [Epulopiscium sp.]|jgi:purine-binding chemotaxis protein CheW|uniref:Chemotaxis protein CheW n=1 Tax=Defluviitalea raffinosedens TaxID=1450156 RepID=A0A7C8LEB3_9FIRM|nr:chemotaxis protein CheW [Defluviitalea raffinosedens]KAE9637061.1 chemotaxis protein CheW [Defluviitalea raffinosedens]MBM7685183.1 purine-binding chemotaxis protein CheW [Defluviitalea raffinosedens]MBZ4669256.1 CheW protein [Defluviitaleaceae bacterium]MDK2787171.1 purine-binding chemotaxis protein CheW [Candidatus Epulonipiscium sp.]
MENISNSESKQYVVFKLGNEEYGIDIQKVQIIERIQNITRVPKSPYFIKGVINLRGEIIPVMSLRSKFGLQEDDYNDETRIIIVEIEDSKIGMIVDQVKEVLQISSQAIENVQGFTSDINFNYIQGVGKVNDHIVTLLNLKNIIDSNM